MYFNVPFFLVSKLVLYVDLDSYCKVLMMLGSNYVGEKSCQWQQDGPKRKKLVATSPT